MQGKKDPEQKIFYSVSLGDLVPEDHPVRRLSKVLDLSFIYGATRRYYSHEGKPSIDPVVLFKLYILGYFFGISSERQILREAQVNLAYRWYLGYDIDEQLPDHSIMTKSRYRFAKEVFAQLFARIIGLCREAGLISGDYHFVDSTLVKADASKDSFGSKLKSEDEYLADLEKREGKQFHGSAFDGEVDPEKMGRRRERNRKNDDYVSRSDPDARMISRSGKGTFSAYKGHVCVDRKRRVILSVDGSVATDDDMTKIDELYTAGVFSAGRSPHTVIGDSHYGGIEAYKYFQDKGIATCMPMRKAKSNGERHPNSEFEVSGDRLHCICPQGHRSKWRSDNKKRYRYIYGFDAAECNCCPDKSCCTKSDKGRLVTFFKGEYAQRAQELVTSTDGKKLMRARQIVVEGVIGEMKSHHLLRRCKYRGLGNFKIQLLLTAAVINLKRLMKEEHKGRIPATAMVWSTLKNSLRLLLPANVCRN